jgi:microcystin-dependent protein
VSNPFMGEIRIFPFAFAPQGWATCDGQILPSNQHTALSALLGKMYGGDGTNTFGLPDLRGRVAIHTAFDAVHGGATSGEYLTQDQGGSGGTEVSTLTADELPAHRHTFVGTTKNADQAAFQTGVFATASNLYASPQGAGVMHLDTVGDTGNSQPHDNMQPYLVLNFCIALNGVIPLKS